jgi:radical SAM superfamily enzyme YgiQ (UPF0313 family)
MKILLINPYWPYPYNRGEYTYNRIWIPLSLANCAAVLQKNGFDVKILDCHALRIKPASISDYAKGYDKIFITSSPLDKWQCPNIDISHFLQTVQYLKTLTEEVYLIGYHGTAEPQRLLNLTKAKAVLRGEPEETILEVCREEKLHKIGGISFADNGRIVSTSSRNLVDMKLLPTPAYHLLDFKRYFYEVLGRNFALFEVSRGCSFRCKFCNKIMYGEDARTKTREQVLEEIKQGVEAYGVRTGYFIDLDFLSNRTIAEEVCEYLISKKYKFRWTCQTRPDLLDADILKKMKMAGCQLIHIGIEAGFQRSLDYLNKNITVTEADRALKLCRKTGIKTLAFFLFGLPDETERDRAKALSLIKKMNPTLVSFHRLIPYKGADISCSEFMRDDVNRFIRKAFFKYYLRPSYLWKLSIPTILTTTKLFYGRIKTL